MLWALWIMAGGYAYSPGGLWQPQPVAYFATRQGCDDTRIAVSKLVATNGGHTLTMQCIQADYRALPK